jgi:hypothetical protein
MSREGKLSLAAGVAAAVAAAAWLALGLLDGPWGMILGGVSSEEGRPCGEVAWERLAAMAKYDLDPGGRAARTEVWWFRLGPR